MDKCESIFKKTIDSDLCLALLLDEGEVCSDALFTKAIIDINFYKEEISNKCKQIINQLENNNIDSILSILNKIFINDKIVFKISSHKEEIYRGNDIIIGFSTFNAKELFITTKINKSIANMTSIIEKGLIRRHEILNSDFKKIINTFKNRQEEINYLSNKFRIEEYAWQIINSFKIFGKNKEITKKLLQTKNFIKSKFSKILEHYHIRFNNKKKNNYDNKILKELYKYMFEYLELGK